MGLLERKDDDMNNEIFETITASLIRTIKAGQAGKWQKPWTTTFANMGLPGNATTLKPYSGINVLVLWMAGLDNDYPTARWATFKQWQGIGAQVRKGEKGTKCVKWGVSVTCECGYKGPKACTKHPVKQQSKRVWASQFTVFNEAQVDGYEAPEVVTSPDTVTIDTMEAWVASTGANIREVAGDRAYYNRESDQITVPLRTQFNTPQGFYGTVLHELGHWTGALSRLAREKGKRFGDHAYAAEELIAELTAVYLSAQLGVEVEPHQEHAAYLESWLGVLEADPMNLYRAAKDAQAAATYLTDLARVGEVADNERTAA